jgi:hypothetical protein
MKEPSLILLCALIAFSLGVPLATVAQSPVQVQVIPDQLNIRDTPNGTLIGQYTRGASLNIQGREDRLAYEGLWVYASDGSLSGWVLSDFLAFPPNFDLTSLPVVNATGGGVHPANPETAPAPPAAPSGGISALTGGQVNFRGGAGTGFEILQTLNSGITVPLIGRNTDGSWLLSVVNGQQGWLFRELVQVSGDVNSLPVIGAEAQPNNDEAAPPQPSYTGEGVISNITPHAREIYIKGVGLGNRPDVFSKVGDSITASEKFLRPLGIGGLRLDAYGYLGDAFNRFSRTTARTHNSFANFSLAARNNWTSYDVLNPANNAPGTCPADMMPLVCEYTLTKPSIALIMFGTNDVAWVEPEAFSINLDTIIQISADMGVIPVLSTIPDKPSGEGGGNVDHFNRIIRDAAGRHSIPLWDYWSAMQGLPNRGISTDGIHPSFDPRSGETGIFTPEGLVYGYNMRNLTALMVLDAVWRGVMY